MLLSVFMSLRRGRRALFFIMGTIVCAAAQAQPAGVEGTMPEDFLPPLKAILTTALKQAPTTIGRELEIESTRAGVIAANSSLYPNLGGDVSYARNKTANSDNSSASSTNNGLYYSFGLSQSVFHWGALKNEREKARISVLISEKNYKDAYRALAMTLRRAYLDLIVKKAIISYRRALRGLKEADLKAWEERVKEGTASGGDLASRQLELADDSISLRTLQVEFAGQRRDFGRLAGIPDPTEDSIPDELPAPVFREQVARDLLAEMVRTGARSTFQAEMAEMRVRQADLDYRIARVRQLPKFNLGASYGLENTTNASSNAVTQEAVTHQTISFGAHWNIFDGFSTRAAKMQARINQRRSERELESITEASLDAAQGLFEKLPIEVESMRLADLRYGLSDVLAKKLKEEFDLGTVSKNSVTGAEVSIKGSTASNFAARASFLARWAEFVSLTSVDPVLSNIPARYDREKR